MTKKMKTRLDEFGLFDIWNTCLKETFEKNILFDNKSSNVELRAIIQQAITTDDTKTLLITSFSWDQCVLYDLFGKVSNAYNKSL